MKNGASQFNNDSDGEFLWLMSLSDLMILLFVFFVVLFSFTYPKLKDKDLQRISSKLKGEQLIEPLDQVQEKLIKWSLDKKILSSVDIQKKEDALILQIKENLLFESGGYQLKHDGKELIQEIKGAFSKIPLAYRIGIEGHTDDIPLKNKNFTGNWELASKRALEVFKVFNFSAKEQKRIVLMSYGPTHPILPNRDKKGRALEANQAKNRRVTIRIF